MQVVKPEFVLTSEDMPHKSLNRRPLSGHGDMADWGVAVEERADNGLVVDVCRNAAEPVILGYVGKKILAVVLTDSLYAPRHTTLRQFAHRVGAHDGLVVGSGNPHKAVFLDFVVLHSVQGLRSRATLGDYARHIALSVKRFLSDLDRHEDFVSSPIPERGVAHSEFLHHLLLRQQGFLRRAYHRGEQFRFRCRDGLVHQEQQVFGGDADGNPGNSAFN